MKKSVGAMSLKELREFAKNQNIDFAEIMNRLEIVRLLRKMKIDGVENELPYQDPLFPPSKLKNPKSINLESYELVVGVDSSYEPYVKYVPKKWIKKHNIDFQKLHNGEYDSFIEEEFSSFKTLEVLHYLNN